MKDLKGLPHTHNNSSKMNVDLLSLEMSGKLKNSLIRHDIRSLESLTSLTKLEFSSKESVGQKTANEAEVLLSELGATFAPISPNDKAYKEKTAFIVNSIMEKNPDIVPTILENAFYFLSKRKTV